jgi:hypothetical protein
MSFAPALDDAFAVGIRPALETDCGFRAVRVDRDPHNDSTTDRIVAGIRTCQFMVADFTLQRQGVYYEAGLAQGLGRRSYVPVGQITSTSYISIRDRFFT